jgi:diaminohydroxyphosphoribosylaminopyrimidine deaminase/5-amino-6-(5-phosphoribosylamino)uracil reductase
MDDTVHMKRALKLAAKGTGLTFPNPLVGAVITSGGEIVAEGFHVRSGRPHAEIMALEMAGERARGATMYLNLEPCCHYGKTPPCTDSIIKAGISRVVFGILDPNERVMGKGAKILRENGIEVVTGIMAEESLEINLPYVHRTLTGRTFIVLKLALSLDGKVSGREGRYMTCEESRCWVHGLRAQLEAIAVGSGTLHADNPKLDRRLYPSGLEPPVRMVFDTNLKFSSGHSWLEDENVVILYCSDRVDRVRIEELSGAGASVVTLPERDGLLDMKRWVEDISQRGLTSVLVEGGPRIASSMLELGIPDRLILIHAPLITGGNAQNWYEGDTPGAGSRRGDFHLSRVEVLGDDVVTVYDTVEIMDHTGKVTD